MKNQIRAGLLLQLKNLSSEEKSQKSISIETHLHTLLKNESGHWAGYNPLSDEPAIHWSQLSKNIEWCFPVAQDKTLQFKTATKNHQISSLGIREPIDGEVIEPDEISGFVIPGVGFDKKGFRLGRGRGFYDRTLATYAGKKIGVCYAESLCEQLPHEEHDIRCQQVVTDKLIYQTGTSEGDSKWS
ncbi:MAG: 5-formyltetrahydrofolate cyclo-ligase [Bdellovibrionaceae bacterium]|nr:5-formyltetrahydrofolate cyclo-ligase [Bdellovibrio sp.]